MIKSRALQYFALDKFVIAGVAALQPAALLKNDFSQVFPKCSLKFETIVSQEHL